MVNGAGCLRVTRDQEHEGLAEVLDGESLGSVSPCY